jgi:cytochrome b subunit of formate dehydrogenase
MTERAERHLLRFGQPERLMHAVLMASFLALSLTGLPLLFSEAPWAGVVARVFGGLYVTSTLHRIFAVVLILVFLVHLTRIGERLFVRKDTGILWGPESMVPQPKDVADMIAHVRWFLRQGPRPRFDHFTYWEKFDYWAVFWGMGIIGGSGLMLWFPELFSRVLPGWVFNVALLVHGHEALLAVGFIFTIHFFNSHLRPEKFPMDMVIFTGRITEEEMRHERPAQYERLQDEAQMEGLEVEPHPPWLFTLGRVAGTAAVAVGLTLVGLILYAVFTTS